jgi:hypothetical protein
MRARNLHGSAGIGTRLVMKTSLATIAAIVVLGTAVAAYADADAQKSTGRQYVVAVSGMT